MVKKSLKELDLGIIELKKTHQKEVNELKEAFETLSRKYEKVERNPL